VQPLALHPTEAARIEEPTHISQPGLERLVDTRRQSAGEEGPGYVTVQNGQGGTTCFEYATAKM